MKAFKTIGAAALAGAMMLSMAGCSSVKIEKKSMKDFESAVEDNTEIDLNEYSYDNCENLYFYNDWYYIDYFEFNDADEAEDAYDDAFDSFSSNKDHNDYSGSSRNLSTNDYKYFLFNGEIDGSGFFAPLSDEYESIAGSIDGDVYGGVYWVEDTVIVVMVRSHESDDKGYINAILSDLGYPHP
ncbi:MAG: hypothetical protein J5685_05440 [Clostridiales bacterium]|nr:hypothetical protein [Clostridiales bacterium]